MRGTAGRSSATTGGSLPSSTITSSHARCVSCAASAATARRSDAWRSRVGGELTRLHVEHAAPIGTFTGWTPARAITQWAVTKDDV